MRIDPHRVNALCNYCLVIYAGGATDSVSSYTCNVDTGRLYTLVRITTPHYDTELPLDGIQTHVHEYCRPTVLYGTCTCIYIDIEKRGGMMSCSTGGGGGGGGGVWHERLDNMMYMYTQSSQ